MGAVFVSYRRGDAEGQARALFNELTDLLGKDSVFMDVDSIALGRDFRQILQERLGSCDCMLALIGPDWLDIKDASGRRRLESPSDFVRQEIAAALKRNIPVTPVLVRGAQIPAPEQLPDDLKDLAFRNGFELSHTRWESDVQEMLKRLGVGKPDAQPSPQPITLMGGGTDRPVVAGSGGSAVAGRRSGAKMIAIGAAALLMLIFIVALLRSGGDSGSVDRSTDSSPIEPTGGAASPSPAPGGTSALDVTADSAHSGSQTLDPGFEPDPVTVSVQAGGNIDLSSLSLGSACVGWASARPDVIVNLTGSGNRLRFYASSSSDTALAVLDPNGGWHCNDDADGDDPDVTVAPAAPGTYRVWVTTYSRGATGGATLQISELAASRQ
jgi:hypothetical protein